MGILLKFITAIYIFKIVNDAQFPDFFWSVVFQYELMYVVEKDCNPRNIIQLFRYFLNFPPDPEILDLS